MSFSSEWNTEYGSVKRQISEAVTDATLFGWNLVTAKTPVRTGRARSSWNVSVDVVDNSTKRAVKPYPEEKGTGRTYSDPAKPQIDFDIEKNRILFIVNNVEYIGYLEDGTDKIPAFSMVASSLPAINNRLQSQVRGIKAVKR